MFSVLVPNSVMCNFFILVSNTLFLSQYSILCCLYAYCKAKYTFTNLYDN